MARVHLGILPAALRMAGFSDVISDNFFEELKLQGEADHAARPITRRARCIRSRMQLL
jgi:hypothetical protein